MRSLLASVATLAIAVSAQAQAVPDALAKLGAFKTTGAKEFTIVEQTGEFADGIRKTLEGITLPEGFHIGLYAVVPDARHMAVGPQGVVTFVGTRKSEVWAVTDRNKDRVADEVKNFAPSLEKAIPNGPCFSPEGVLYIAEQNRLLAYPAAEFFYESPDVVAVPVIPDGELIPAEHESDNHAARVCRVGPDGKLYVSLGQPYNVTPPELVEPFREAGIGGIIRLNQDGTGREVYVTGIRNSVGHDFNPATGELWFTDNQVDGMGDDIPPGEINRIAAAGQDFGFPWYGGGDVRTNEFADETPPEGLIFPVVETEAHAADLGMIFYAGSMFPAEYRNAIFSAQHGSWNRTVPIGARVMATKIAPDGTARTEPFAEGWLVEATGDYLGRPVDVAELQDGSLLVSDDRAGALYRIWYEAP
ncbi:PQQ-dependent sugar dehydrogenase [Amaricoccus sp.]|uniref:PQQ-dependent sugar dehydrogenase n=1 Tax=Amaricoccus sp. TaxID=1872485 RepID=UPI001B732E33|nr:PQQ-dependent sugar dehydrogenase [Amaricoccus sp.]MBP7000022.1 PQQ-dependent sugar dehydrogenase [Amaricoccus sp.]